MVDLADLWTDDAKAAIYDSVENACQSNDGVFYEYPLCMTAHTMAINRDVFEAADALQYLDEENRTWTTDNFVKAVQAVYDSGQTNVGAVYCSGQGGDQGTRALVNNLYSGTFTNPEHTEYTAWWASSGPILFSRNIGILWRHPLLRLLPVTGPHC